MNVNVNKIVNQIKWSLRKNYSDILALIAFDYPRFVFSNNPAPLKDEIPVFTFHSVKPQSFEQKLKFLKENDYHTLNSEEFYHFLSGEKAFREKSVVLTFDDGTASLWGVAFPLLKKYGFCAISFIIPGCIPEEDALYPNLEEVWSGKVKSDEVTQREHSSNSICNWKEITYMHETRVLDFQSHSMYHNLICVSDKVVDFVNPNFNHYFFANINVPVYRTNGIENVTREVKLGTPIYASEPRLHSKPRYFDSEWVRNHCIEFVAESGGENFFENINWRKILEKEYNNLNNKNCSKLQFESEEEQAENIYHDLYESKKIIEERLPGKNVAHLCFPWYMGSKLSVHQSKRAGYLSNFWGIKRGKNLISPGEDPFYLPRIDERYLLRLPGKGRISLHKILSVQLNENLHGNFKHK